MVRKRETQGRSLTASAAPVPAAPGSSTLVRSRYDLDALVQLSVTDAGLAPPLEARRDALARAFGVDLAALRDGRRAVDGVLEGRDRDAEAARLLALPDLAAVTLRRREMLRERFEEDGVEQSFADLLDIARDCIEGGSVRGPLRMIYIEGMPALAEYVVHARHMGALSDARAALLRATRETFRSCIEILYPNASSVGTVELEEEPYDPLDWF